jgi:hypothetical protein
MMPNLLHALSKEGLPTIKSKKMLTPSFAVIKEIVNNRQVFQTGGFVAPRVLYH